MKIDVPFFVFLGKRINFVGNRIQNMITVKEAIEEGSRRISNIAFLILGLGGAITFYLAYMNIANLIFIILLSILVVVLAVWLSWGLRVAKWKIWAFENVENVHELKRLAIQKKLLLSDDSLFHWLEIMTAIQKQQWAALQKRFKEPDTPTDDPTIPPETIIYYSKSKKIFLLIVQLVILSIFLYFFSQGNDLLLTTAILFFGLLVLAFTGSFSNLNNNTPQITLNDKGMQTATTPFYTWQEIQNEKIISRRVNKVTQTYLTYDSPMGKVSFRIDELGKIEDLEYLFLIYRNRNRLKNKQK